MKIAIVGAGLVGRLLALNALTKNWAVTLFDKDDIHGKQNCGFVAAGMLSPWSELAHCEKMIFDLGVRSLELWPNILKPFHQSVFWRQNGSIILTHAQDRNELDHFATTITKKLSSQDHSISFLTSEQLKQLEPELRHYFQTGIFFEQEGHVCSDDFFQATTTAFLSNPTLTWHANTNVLEVNPFEVVTEKQTDKYDLVFDCRGLGAKHNLTQLRGVRGEVIHLYAPDVTLYHPIRLLHPRYAIYVVPRDKNQFVVGATSIESDDMSEISVQSMMELLSAAYSLHSGFAEARITSTRVQCRPAFPDNAPQIIYENGLVRINGLYRHGYLIAPALIEQVMEKFL